MTYRIVKGPLTGQLYHLQLNTKNASLVGKAICGFKPSIGVLMRYDPQKIRRPHGMGGRVFCKQCMELANEDGVGLIAATLWRLTNDGRTV